MIHFEAFAKVWPDGTRALDDITLNIPKGQFCVILGPSGAGKSTLLRGVNGLTAPSSGKLFIDGVEFNDASRRALRQRIGMIHQHFNLTLRMSVANNVLAGALPKVSTARALSGWFTPAQRRRACALVERVGLSPEHLHRRAGELSGGQQQRVGVARAFMLDPDIVLADEPVASLDPKIARDILALIRDAAAERGATVVCSLHQVDLAREFADRIVGLRAGRVIFDDVPAEFTDARFDSLYHGAVWEETPQSPDPMLALAAA
jgi:phosphonate transport system ATP-binding protein